MALLQRLLPSTRTAALVFALAVLSTTGHAADCTVPPGTFLFEPDLPRFVKRLDDGKPVAIVAIGAASTEGRAAANRNDTWPSQLGAALKQAYPAVAVTVVNLGKGGQTAADMVARFEKDVVPLSPALVVWETGTVDAVRNVDLDTFRDSLTTGVAKLLPVSDVVLMDMQFSRWTHAMIDFEPYEYAMRQIADLSDIPLFPRNRLMREWSETGEIDYTVKGKEKRREMARQLYRCLGNALAVFVTRTGESKETRQ